MFLCLVTHNLPSLLCNSEREETLPTHPLAFFFSGNLPGEPDNFQGDYMNEE